ncbi:MAG: hypothetical protein AAGJ95_13460 [Cyanobacteria bacterium J06554_11]
MQSNFTPEHSEHHSNNCSSKRSSNSLEAEFRQIIQRREINRRKTNRRKTIAAIASHIARALVDYLTGKDALSVRQKLTPNGDCQWIVYDPETRRRHVFTSQQDVRVWLDNHHR